MQTTGKKIKVIGTEQYIQTSTGEIKDFQVSEIIDKDFNFNKIWMKNFISTLEIVGNQKSKLCFWIIDNLNRDNQLIATYRQLADKTGISLETVRVTMKMLLDADFLRKQATGVYIVNPDIVFRGSRTARLNVLNEYAASERIALSDEEKLQNLKNSIDTLMKQAKALEQKIKHKPTQVPGQMELQEDGTLKEVV
jgi:DNA-binding transcriptional regulator YhcF (GntR family)